MRSPTHAVYQASGAAVIGISADFQDPPELIGELIARWRAGAMIVLGVRASEKTSAVLRFIRAIGYGFFERFGDYRVIPNATGFGIYDRRVIDCLRGWRDPEPFFRGMLAETGFPIETVSYHRPGRSRGKSKNNLWSLFNFGISGLASASKDLLRLPIYLSLIVFVTTGLTFVASVVAALSGRSALPLVAAGLVELGFALTFMFLGLMGEQIRLISEMARHTPLVVEMERINFGAGGTNAIERSPGEVKNS